MSERWHWAMPLLASDADLPPETTADLATSGQGNGYAVVVRRDGREARIEMPMWYRDESSERKREMRAEAVRAALEALDCQPDRLPHIRVASPDVALSSGR